MSKYDDLSSLPTAELISRYVTHSIEYDETDRTGDYVVGTAALGRLIAVYGELRRRGRDGQASLLDLLEHPEVGVRSAAATFVMEFAPEQGKPVLEAIVAGGGPRALSAEYRLKMWREGAAMPLPDVQYRSRSSLSEADRWPTVSMEMASVLSEGSNRLDADTPDLADAFRRATIEKRRQAAVTATEMAVAEVGLSDDVVEEAQYALRFEALPALEEHENMKALVARLENEAAQREAGDVNDRGVAIRLRAEARAASSLAIALTGDSTRLDEVIHEAIAAQDEPEGLIAFLTETLRK